MLTDRSDRRRDKRLPLTLPVKFFIGGESSFVPVDGITRNVSPSGIYFEAPAGAVAKDGSIALRIGVPTDRAADKPSLTLLGAGTVCRIDPLDPAQAAGTWSPALLKQGICCVALHFRQRPTVELKSLEGLLWEDKD